MLNSINIKKSKIGTGLVKKLNARPRKKNPFEAKRNMMVRIFKQAPLMLN